MKFVLGWKELQTITTSLDRYGIDLSAEFEDESVNREKGAEVERLYRKLMDLPLDHRHTVDVEERGAAAPDLLAAAKLGLARIESDVSENSPDATLIRAAVARAEGREG